MHKRKCNWKFQIDSDCANFSGCLFFHRPDLLRSEGIPSVDPHPSPSPLSASPKISTPPGKARYRSKPRHRRASSKGSHTDFPGMLRPLAGALEDTQCLQEPPLHPNPHLHHHPLPNQGPILPLKGREEAVVNCANNLRYFGPAAALRSPQTDHLQRHVSGSSPDLISTAVDADTRKRISSSTLNPVPGATAVSLCPCCQAHPFPGCQHCQENPPASSHPDLHHYSLLSTLEESPTSLVVPSHNPATDREVTKQTEPQEQETSQHTHTLPIALPHTLRPLRKVGSLTPGPLPCFWLKGTVSVDDELVVFGRVEMSHLKRRREKWTVKWSFQGDRGKIKSGRFYNSGSRKIDPF